MLAVPVNSGLPSQHAKFLFFLQNKKNFLKTAWH